ncbi:hypothetical protein [Nonomuraea sediminis]|uniref:hypothetical protein n=1 Tax=Nonomuraea sediminis TaxID=2835864 RepID=UPI00202A57F1|nr:hypothetical protein [Nonomuraea sediminis]
MAFVPEQASIQELSAARLHPPVHDRVHPRHSDTGEHNLDAGVDEDLLHEGWELPVLVSDQEARPAARVSQIHHDILDHLDDPGSGRVRGGAQHANAPGGMLDDGENVLTLAVQGDGFDDIASQQRVGLRAQEGRPRDRCSLRGRIYSSCLRISGTAEARS